MFSHPFYAVTGPDGRYLISRVPPGTYSVIAWNEGIASSSRSVTVTEGGTADADFVLR